MGNIHICCKISFSWLKKTQVPGQENSHSDDSSVCK